MLDKLLLSVTRISTFSGEQSLTQATGFFYRRNGELFVITNKHVVFDEPSGHHPDRIELELHANVKNLVETVNVVLNLYENQVAIWREAKDSGGIVDVVAIPVNAALVPETAVYHAFTPRHVVDDFTGYEIGTRLAIVGFPLGFHDTLHHLPIARQASLASAFGVRFQGQGFFLTDARMHRGASGSPVVCHAPDLLADGDQLPWRVLGVHASRFDVGTRDLTADEALGLNAAWYVDVLTTLSDPVPEPSPEEPEVQDAPMAGENAEIADDSRTQPPALTPAIPSVISR